MSRLRIRVHDLALYGPVPMNEMAYRKSQMEAKLISQTRNIVEWWGFLYYMAHYGDVNNLTNHEKGKLRSLLKELYEDKLLVGNPSKVKRNTLLLHWGDGNRDIPGIELLSDVSRVESFISDRFYEEQIDVSDEILNEVAVAFMQDAPTLVDLIADGDSQKIFAYIDSTFPSSTTPQKVKNRRRKG